MGDDLVQNVGQKISERRHFTISEFHVNFSHCSLRDITVRLDYHQKFCARWVPKMLGGAHKTQRMASAFVGLFRALPQKWI
jgi:hypothetical protein